MLEARNINSAAPIGLVSDPRPLAREIACANAPSVWRPLATLETPDVVDIATLRLFLEDYRARVLGTIELPAVRDSYHHADHYQVRELISLDVGMNQAENFKRFSQASKAVGRRQLRRLLPMRDQRLVRRYWRAIELGEANGWHPVVFGVVIALFSLPLRQGLIHYAYQTLSGFLKAGAARLALPPAKVTLVFDELTAALPAAVESTLRRKEIDIRDSR